MRRILQTTLLPEPIPPETAIVFIFPYDLFATEFLDDIFHTIGFYRKVLIKLANIVFSDGLKLNRLNEIVHGEVRADLARWFDKCREEGCEKAFVETAILYQSGLDRMVDEVWEVEAPERVRIERVTKRNSVSVEEVESRIRAQQAYTVDNPHPNSVVVINDGVMPLLPQIESLLR